MRTSLREAADALAVSFMTYYNAQSSFIRINIHFSGKKTPALSASSGKSGSANPTLLSCELL